MQLQTPVKFVIGGFIAILIAGYGAHQFLQYAEGPTIAITTPVNGSVLKNELVTISGEAENISSISLNGGEIYTDPNGNFQEKLLLDPGYNALQVKVADRFGRIETKIIEIMYRPDVYTRDGTAITQKSTVPDSL